MLTFFVVCVFILVLFLWSLAIPCCGICIELRLTPLIGIWLWTVCKCGTRYRWKNVIMHPKWFDFVFIHVDFFIVGLLLNRLSTLTWCICWTHSIQWIKWILVYILILNIYSDILLNFPLPNLVIKCRICKTTGSWQPNAVYNL